MPRRVHVIVDLSHTTLLLHVRACAPAILPDTSTVHAFVFLHLAIVSIAVAMGNVHARLTTGAFMTQRGYFAACTFSVREFARMKNKGWLQSMANLTLV